MGGIFRPIIGGNGNPSRGKCWFRRKGLPPDYFFSEASATQFNHSYKHNPKEAKFMNGTLHH
jgi:hypothetical protein